MSSARKVGRFLLEDRISVRTPQGGESSFRSYPVESWFGHDELLNRPVSVRMVRNDDARIAAVLGAARAASLLDDPRLMRVLDVIDVPATEDEPSRTAIISEWAEGRSLVDELLANGPMDAQRALTVAGEIAQALAIALDKGVPHGRLSPTTVYFTDEGDVRVRGLAVDAALFGPLESDNRGATFTSDDVDGLGSLLYAMVTGYWPDPSVRESEVGIALAPLAGRTVALPSNVSAQVPGAIDDVVGRSVLSISRPRGSVRIADASGFATAVRAATDRLASGSAATALLTRPKISRSSRGAARREREGAAIAQPTTARGVITGIVIAAVVVAGFVIAGITLMNAAQPSAENQAQTLSAEEILNGSATPFVEEFSFAQPKTPVPIVAVRSYDPFADDNNDGKTDKRKGRENEDDAPLAIDVDPATEWLTDTYSSADADGKGGVGLIADLGQPMNIDAVSLSLRGYGSDVSVLVADEIYKDPALWTPFVAVDEAGPTIDLRSARPVRGQYVLVWFTELPREPGSTDTYVGGIGNLAIYASPDTNPAPSASESPSAQASTAQASTA